MGIEAQSGNGLNITYVPVENELEIQSDAENLDTE